MSILCVDLMLNDTYIICHKKKGKLLLPSVFFQTITDVHFHALWMFNIDSLFVIVVCCTLVENLEHCDFIALRNMLIRTHLQDLKDVTNNVHYENYRCRKLAGLGTDGKPTRISNK
jgi:hypothetical protein